MARYRGQITLETAEWVDAETREEAEKELQAIVDRDYPHETRLDDVFNEDLEE